MLFSKIKKENKNNKNSKSLFQNNDNNKNNNTTTMTKLEQMRSTLLARKEEREQRKQGNYSIAAAATSIDSIAFDKAALADLNDLKSTQKLSEQGGFILKNEKGNLNRIIFSMNEIPLDSIQYFSIRGTPIKRLNRFEIMLSNNSVRVAAPFAIAWAAPPEKSAAEAEARYVKEACVRVEQCARRIEHAYDAYVTAAFVEQR